MILRTALIVSWPMAQPGAILSIDEITSRTAAYLTAIKIDLPCLQHLQASEVLHDVQVTAQGMTWRATLREVPQIALRFAGKEAGGFDLFQQDLELLRQAQDKLTQDYRLAMSDAREPSSDTRTANLRQRVRHDRQGRRLHIAAQADQFELLLPEHLPHLMPLAEVCEAQIQILNMSSNWATVKLANVLHLPSSNISIPLGTKLQLLRGSRFSGVEAGHQLQTAMDTRQVLRIRAAVARRWESGAVNSLELHGFSGTPNIARNEILGCHAGKEHPPGFIQQQHRTQQDVERSQVGSELHLGVAQLVSNLQK
jgi:hypothetical protein